MPLSLAAARQVCTKARREVMMGRDPNDEYIAERARRRAALAEKASSKTARHAVIDLKYVLGPNTLPTEERTDGIDLVYFVKIGSVIKIGHTTQIEQRLKALRGATSEKVTLLACFPGGEKLEKQVHRHLRAARVPQTNEFFESSVAFDLVTAVSEFASNASRTDATQGETNLRVIDGGRNESCEGDVA